MCLQVGLGPKELHSNAEATREMIDPIMSVESSRGFPNSSAVAIRAAKVVIAEVLPKLHQAGEVFTHLAVFARNVESRASAML